MHPVISKALSVAAAAAITLLAGFAVANQDAPGSGMADLDAAAALLRNPAGEARPLLEILAESDLTRRDVLERLVRQYPEETALIVAEAAFARADARTIAHTCQPDLPAEQITVIAVTALGENVDPEPILERCLRAVKPEDLVNFVMRALTVLDPLQFESHLALMLQLMERDGIDGSTVLVSSLVQGDFLVSEEIGADCRGDCLRPFAEELVSDIEAPGADDVPTDPDVFVDADLDDEEPPLSNS